MALPVESKPLVVAPLREARSRVMTWPAMLVGLAVLMALANLGRLDHLTSDQFSQGTMAWDAVDPALFASDRLYGEANLYEFYLPWFRSVMAWLTGLLGGPAWTFWVLALVLTAASLLTLYVLLIAMAVRPSVAALAAVIGTLPRLSLGDTLWGAGIMETALPRTFFSALFAVPVLVLYRARFRGWKVPVAFLLVGLLGNLHPQSGLFATLILGGVVLVMGRFRWQSLVAVAAGGVCALVGITPFLFQSSELMAQLRADVFPGGLGTVSLFEELRRLGSAATGMLTERSAAKAGVFGLCMLPMLVAVWLSHRACRQDPRLRAAVVGAYVAVGFCLLAEVAKHCLMFYWGDWPTKITWLRGTRYLHFFGAVAVGVALARGNLPWRWPRWRGIVLVLLTLGAVVASLGAMEYVQRSRFMPHRAAAAWAARTPRGTRFLVDPYPALAFRFWSRRPVAIAEHDVQFYLVGDSRHFREAARLASSLKHCYHARDWAEVAEWARRTGSTYVVAPAAARAVMKPVFRPAGGPWVFEAPGEPGADLPGAASRRGDRTTSREDKST